jgi:hypothetical protein
MESNLIMAGVDEYGLSIGYAQKAGSLYLGVSYSGSLIDELFRRMTNQDVLTLRKQDTVTETSYLTSLIDQDGKTPPGETVSNNDINLILGAGSFGLRVGFAEYIRAVEISSEDPYWLKEKTFESSMKPSLELGFNFKAGPVRVKPGLRVAFDIHDFKSSIGVVEDVSAVVAGGLFTAPGNNWVIHDRLINFSEASAGITLGFDFSDSETVSSELILDGDFALRFYRTEDDPDRIRSNWWADSTSSGYPEFPTPVTPGPPPVPQDPTIGYAVSIPTDLRIAGVPRFVYTGDLGQRLTLGMKLEVGTGFEMLTIEQTESGITTGERSSSISAFSITPDFSIGASFHLIPEHFSLHAGLGLMLFSYRQVSTETSVNGTDEPKITEKTMGLPSARFAAGLTLNFTENVAMDLMAITSGITIDATKFTLLLTVKN